MSFLLRFPWGFPRWTLSSTLLYGVRTFLEDPSEDASPRLPRLRAKYNSKEAADGRYSLAFHPSGMGKGLAK